MAVLIVPITLANADATAPPEPVPKAALAEPTTQAANITYSRDTTPSWFVRRRFNEPVDVPRYLNIGRFLLCMGLFWRFPT